MKYTSNDNQKKLNIKTINSSLINSSQNNQIQNRISQLGGMGGIDSLRRDRHSNVMDNATTAS